MKKVKVFFTTLIGMLLFYSNTAYATTKGTYVPVESNGIEKLVLIAIGVGLVSLVLFIGYKMDKKDESKRRREKFIKDNQKDSISDEEDAYSMVYNTINNSSEENSNLDNDSYKEDSIFENSNSTVENSSSNFEDTDIYNLNEVEEQENEETEDVEETENDEYEDEYVEEYDEKYEEEEDNELEETDDYDEDYEEYETTEDEDDYYETEEDEEQEEYEEDSDEQENDDELIYNSGFSENNKNIEKMISVFENSDSTMVFNSKDLKMESQNDNFSNTAKGYDYDEDSDLEDIQNTIKEANIKRYTRKKKKEEPPKKNVKRYTRKKPVVEEVHEEIEENTVEEVVEEVKPKRGRPKKTDQVEKPKRGRPKKTEVTKSKRGRPKKSTTTTKKK